MGTNEYQSFNFILGTPLSYCLHTETNKGKNKEGIRNCYYKFFPEARVLCLPQLDDVIEWCGMDGRTHPECHNLWRLLQRCVKSNSIWEDLDRRPSRKSDKPKPVILDDTKKEVK